MSKHFRIGRKSQKTGFSGGFTIVELMIALSVLSVLLIICTVTLMNLGKMYVKGDNMARAQQASRDIVQMISDHIRLGGNLPINYNYSGLDNSDGYFCIGRVRYSYVLDRQVSGSPDSSLHQTRHALWRDELPSSTCPIFNPPASLPLDLSWASPSANGQELVPANMRLTELKVAVVNGDSGTYSVTAGVAYGDNDLLCNPNPSATINGKSDCDVAAIASDPGNNHYNNLRSAGGNIKCIGGTGQQFCAVSSLSVTVARRVISE